MGGYGSGSWSRWHSKRTTESQHRIDVRLLKKWGHLRGGSMSMGTWSWSRNGKQTGSIGYRVDSERMILNYRHRLHGGEWEAVQQHISLDRTPCNYGGYRSWFFCPYCSRRVAVLYGAGKYFLCRHCHGLAYSSQQETFSDRMLRRARKIRTRLDKNNIPIDPFPLKPKNMHWKTYYRLRDRAEQADAIGWGIWAQRLEGCYAMLDRTLKRIGPHKANRGNTKRKLPHVDNQ